MRRVIGTIVGGGVAIFAGANAIDDNTTRNDSGEIVEEGGLGVLAIKVGDCVQLPDQVLVQSVQGVPCAEPHDAQVYAEFVVPAIDWPGDAGMEQLAGEGCFDRWQAAIGTDYQTDPVLDFTVFSPTEAGWAEGDHEAQCMVVRIDGTQMAGDLLAG